MWPSEPVQVRYYYVTYKYATRLIMRLSMRHFSEVVTRRDIMKTYLVPRVRLVVFVCTIHSYAVNLGDGLLHAVSKV